MSGPAPPFDPLPPLNRGQIALELAAIQAAHQQIVESLARLLSLMTVPR